MYYQITFDGTRRLRGVVATHAPGTADASERMARIEPKRRKFRDYPMDVADFNSYEACVKQTSEKVGSIDILANNACLLRDASLKNFGKANWETVLLTKLDSIFNMAAPVCDGMVTRAWQHIVKVSSIIRSKGGFG